MWLLTQIVHFLEKHMHKGAHAEILVMTFLITNLYIIMKVLAGLSMAVSAACKQIRWIIAAGTGKSPRYIIS